MIIMVLNRGTTRTNKHICLFNSSCIIYKKSLPKSRDHELILSGQTKSFRLNFKGVLILFNFNTEAKRQSATTRKLGTTLKAQSATVYRLQRPGPKTRIKMAFFGLKILGQDFKKQAIHTHKEFRVVPHPPPHDLFFFAGFFYNQERQISLLKVMRFLQRRIFSNKNKQKKQEVNDG